MEFPDFGKQINPLKGDDLTIKRVIPVTPIIIPIIPDDTDPEDQETIIPNIDVPTIEIIPDDVDPDSQDTEGI